MRPRPRNLQPRFGPEGTYGHTDETPERPDHVLLLLAGGRRNGPVPDRARRVSQQPPSRGRSRDHLRPLSPLALVGEQAGHALRGSRRRDGPAGRSSTTWPRETSITRAYLTTSRTRPGRGRSTGSGRAGCEAKTSGSAARGLDGGAAAFAGQARAGVRWAQHTSGRNLRRIASTCGRRAAASTCLKRPRAGRLAIALMRLSSVPGV
jgi:hypothetical protein